MIRMEERFSSVQRAWLTEAGIEYEKLPEHILLELYPDVLHYGSRKEVVMLMKERLLASVESDNQLTDELYEWYNAGREAGLQALNESWQLSVDAQDIADAAYTKSDFSSNKLRLGLGCMTLANIIVFCGYQLDDNSKSLVETFSAWCSLERSDQLTKLWRELGLSV